MTACIAAQACPCTAHITGRRPPGGQRTAHRQGNAMRQALTPAAAPGVAAGTKPVPLRCTPLNCCGSSTCAIRMADRRRFNAVDGLQREG
jgi:hypothetical protein